MRLRFIVAGGGFLAGLVACGDDSDGTGGSGGDATSTSSGSAAVTTSASASSSSRSSADASSTAEVGSTSGSGGGEGGANATGQRGGGFSLSGDADLDGTTLLSGNFFVLVDEGVEDCEVLDSRGACEIYECGNGTPPTTAPLIGGTVTFETSLDSIEVEPVEDIYYSTYPGPFFEPEEDVSISHVASDDVPAFTLSVRAPGHASMVSPTFEENELIPLDEDLEVTWTTVGTEGVLRLFINGEARTVFCEFPLEDGAGTLDQALLVRLSGALPQNATMNAVEIHTSAMEIDDGFEVSLDAGGLAGADANPDGVALTTVFIP